MATKPAFAVVATYSLLCPETDAIMGTGHSVVARFATMAEATAEADRRTADEDSECTYEATLRPYREGEERMQRPIHSMPERIADEWAWRRDAGHPEWAL